MIRDELAGDPAIVARFRSEVKLARRVTHTNVARTFELGRADGVLFCTMELVDGQPLTKRLARGALPVADAASIAIALCDGLAAAHAAGIVHRDLKPDNILLATDGRVVLADFGVAALREAAGDSSGTPAYMAPEQARGEPPTPAVDVYAVGVVLFEMLTGRRAFAGDARKVLADKAAIERLVVEGELADVVARATARDLPERTATAEALGRALAPWKTTTSPAIRPSTPTIIVRRPDLQTVVVLAPTAAAEHASRLYVAQATHVELLARLARKPRVRVLPRNSGDVGEDAAVVITLEARERLVVRLATRADTSQLELPLAVERVDANADAIAGALASALEPWPDEPSTALDLAYRARYEIVQLGNFGVGSALEMTERAHAQAPGDARISAMLAGMLVRLAFLDPDGAEANLARAGALARGVVQSHPQLAGGHLAAGHVALHSGRAVDAAASYRAAITCAPLDAEAHERLGLMLLEAGYIDAALARLDEALAIEPLRYSAQWEIARAWALDQRWAEHDRLVDKLSQTLQERGMARLRFACWRGDRELIRTAATFRGFNDVVATGYREAVVDGKWLEFRDRLVGYAAQPTANVRRRTFINQLVAEVAAYSGDVDTCTELIARATDNGLFDLHWMDKCPMLAPVRGTPRFADLRARIKARADAILDALYGDHVVELSATTIASHIASDI